MGKLHYSYDKKVFKDLGDGWLEHIPTKLWVFYDDTMKLKVFFYWVIDHLNGKDKDYKKYFKTIQPLLWDVFYQGVLAQKYEWEYPDGVNPKVDKKYYGNKK